MFGRRRMSASLKKIHIKRIYEPPAASDGKRVLVDRLWPRGAARDAARIDAWIKAVAPSDALRRWYSHDLEKWPKFRARYIAELKHNPRSSSCKTWPRKAKPLRCCSQPRTTCAITRQFCKNSCAAARRRSETYFLSRRATQNRRWSERRRTSSGIVRSIFSASRRRTRSSAPVMAAPSTASTISPVRRPA